MEDYAVIGFFASQFLDAGNVARSEVRQKLDHDLALGGFHDEGVFGILDLRHVYLLACLSGFLLVENRGFVPLLLGDRDLDHLVGVADFAIAALAALDLVDEFHAGLDLTDDRILAV